MPKLGGTVPLIFLSNVFSQVFERDIQPAPLNPYETSYSDGPGYTTTTTTTDSTSGPGGSPRIPGPAYSKYVVGSGSGSGSGSNPFLPGEGSSAANAIQDATVYIIETSYGGGGGGNGDGNSGNNVYLGPGNNNLTPSTGSIQHQATQDVVSNELEAIPDVSTPAPTNTVIIPSQPLAGSNDDDVLYLTNDLPPPRPPSPPSPPPPSSFGPASLLRLTPQGPTVPVLSQLSSDLDAAVRGIFGLHRGRNSHYYNKNRNRLKSKPLRRPLPPPPPPHRFKGPSQRQGFTSR